MLSEDAVCAIRVGGSIAHSRPRVGHRHLPTRSRGSHLQTTQSPRFCRHRLPQVGISSITSSPHQSTGRRTGGSETGLSLSVDSGRTWPATSARTRRNGRLPKASRGTFRLPSSSNRDGADTRLAVTRMRFDAGTRGTTKPVGTSLPNMTTSSEDCKPKRLGMDCDCGRPG